jgi:hypothetical protein
LNPLQSSESVAKRVPPAKYQAVTKGVESVNKFLRKRGVLILILEGGAFSTPCGGANDTIV